MSQRLKIPTHLNLKLAALYDEPATRAPHPLVILCHGFTGRKEEGHIASLAAALDKAGIAALRFDAPGSGESDGTWAEDYRLTNYINVVPDVLAYARKQFEIDAKRVAIWGHSMGGYVALNTAVNHPKEFVAVCASQPSSGRGSLVSEKVDEWRKAGWWTFSNHAFPEIKLPYEFYEDREQYDAIKELTGLKIPVLFLSGTQDELVPAGKVKSMFEASPEPKKYLETGATHSYKHDPEMLAKINTATVEFFKQKLQP